MSALRWARISWFETCLVLAALGGAAGAEAQTVRGLVQSVDPGILGEKGLSLMREGNTIARIETDYLTRNIPATQSRLFLIDLGDRPIAIARLSQDDVSAEQRGWKGDLVGLPESNVVFVVGRDSAVWGSVQIADTIYRLRQVQGQFHVILRRSKSEFPDELQPPRPPRTGPAADSGLVRLPSADAPPEPACPSPVLVRTLVVYTRAASERSLADSVPMPIEVRAALSVQLTNLALQNSGVAHRVQLADVVEVPYGDDPGADFYTHLERLRSRSDGLLDGVHALRRQHRANVVSMWVSDGNACGVGYVPTGVTSARDSAFHVVAVSCATDNESFAHELGHNLGLEHDRANAQGYTGVDPYSYGYQDVNGEFRTIMAYRQGCPAGGECNRKLYFSDPTGTFSNRPLGVDHARDPQNSAMNSISLRKTMCRASRWKP